MAKPILTHEEKAHLQRTRLLTHPIPRIVTALAIPSMMQQLVSVLYNLVDTYFVSQISTEASAALGVVFSLVSLLNAIMFGISMGAKAIMSRRLGAGDLEAAHRVGSSALAMEITFGALSTILGLIFIEPILRFFGADASVMPHAIAYSRILLLGVTVHATDAALGAVLTSQGKTIYNMLGFGIASIVNAVLDWVFIFPLQMGAAGAALATIISQGISCLILVSALLAGKSAVKLRFRYISLKFRMYFDIVHNGIATVFRQGTAAVATTMLNRLASPYGAATVAAISIANKIYLMVRNLVLGFGQGFQPVAGYNYGAKIPSRVKKSFWFTSFAGTCICIAGAIIIAAMPETLIALFRKDVEVVTLGAQMLQFYAVILPLLAFSTFVNQMYQCLGFSLWATVLACCRQGICFIPLLYLLHGKFGQVGLCMAQPAADLATFLVSIPFLIWFFKKVLNKPDAEINL